MKYIFYHLAIISNQIFIKMQFAIILLMTHNLHLICDFHFLLSMLFGLKE